MLLELVGLRLRPTMITTYGQWRAIEWLTLRRQGRGKAMTRPRYPLMPLILINGILKLQVWLRIGGKTMEIWELTIAFIASVPRATFIGE